MKQALTPKARQLRLAEILLTDESLSPNEFRKVAIEMAELVLALSKERPDAT